MGFLSLPRSCALSGFALTFLVLAMPTASAEDTITPPKIDLSRWNDQPVYPDGALAKNEHGNTVLAVSIDARSRVTKVDVDKTSGYDDLDQTAVAAAKQLRYDAATDGHKDVPGVMTLTVHFQLTPVPRPTITASDVYAAKDSGDLIVCKRQDPPVGSLIAPKPVCRTSREWDQIQRQKKDQNIPDRPHSPFFQN